MECKNCATTLSSEQNYCTDCGAKVIRNRLTFKNLWNNFTEQFLSVDNTFLKTFIHLFTKPEVVIGGYIDGVRKKYVNPIGYLAFSIVLSGTMFFILQKGYGMTLTDTDMISGSIDKVIDYQSLITYLGFPFYAIASLLIFIDIQKFNLPEHLIINAYWLAQFSIVQFLVFVPLFGFFNVSYTKLEIYVLFIIIWYLLFILKKLHETSLKSTILRGLLYTPIFVLISIISTLPIVIYLFITGDFTIEMFVPKK